MNNADAIEYFDALVTLLTNKNASWVVEQVNEEIRFGKIVSGEFSLSEEKTFNKVFQDRLLEQKGVYRANKKEKLNQIIPFTSQERLILLIKAIKRLVIDSSSIQEQLISFVEKEVEKTAITPDVRFFSEELNEESYSLSKSKLGINKESVTSLDQLLSQLELEAQNDH